MGHGTSHGTGHGTVHGTGHGMSHGMGHGTGHGTVYGTGHGRLPFVLLDQLQTKYNDTENDTIVCGKRSVHQTTQNL